MRTTTDRVAAVVAGNLKSAPVAEVQDSGIAIARRFHPRVRSAVRSFVASSPRAADLASVFPAAAHTIATRAAPQADVERALRLTQDGAPLRDVARALGLPLWLRRLPPEAFHRPVGAVPSSEMFTRRIANQLPVAPEQSAFWLASVTFAAKACDEYFALWLASQRIFGERQRDAERLFAVLAAYAWFSTADDTRAHHLIVTPWRPEMAFDTAVCAAKSWLNRIRLVLQLREGVITDPWLTPSEVSGYSFVPLLWHGDILAESRAMQNCTDQYGDRIARNVCRLFSVRRRGVRVATLEIGPHPREPHILALNQLKARHNLPAAVEIWQATHAWLATQPNIRRIADPVVPDRPLQRTPWAALMAPYRTATNGARWIPQKPTADAFSALDRAMADLARRGGVSSWLFT